MKNLDPKKRSNIIPKARRNEDGKPICRWCGSLVPKGRRAWCSQACVDDALIRTNPAFARQKVEERDNGICANCNLDTRAITNTIRRLGTIAGEGMLGYSRSTNRASKRYGIKPDRLFDVLKAGTSNFERAIHEEREAARIAAGGIPGRRPFHDIPLEVTGVEQRTRNIHRRMKRLFAARLARVCQELIAQGFDGIGSRGFVTRSLWDADHIVPVVKGGGGCGLENYRTLCQPCHKAETAALAAARAAERRGALPSQQPELEFE